MSENSTRSGHLDTTPTDPPSPLHGSKAGSSAMSQDRYVSMTSGPPKEPEKEERRGDTEELRRLRRDYDNYRSETQRNYDIYRNEIQRLKGEEENLRREQTKLRGNCQYCRPKDARIANLEHNIAVMSGAWQGMEAQTRKAQAMEEELKKTKEELKQTRELLEARTAELSEAQTFLSMTDRLSEMEVLGIVRDLNENIFQLAVGLTEERDKLEPLQATGPIEVDLTSQPRDPVLVQLARKRDLTGSTYLLQSFLCHQAVDMTSSWVRNQESGGFGSVYERISASGQYRVINTK